MSTYICDKILRPYQGRGAIGSPSERCRKVAPLLVSESLWCTKRTKTAAAGRATARAHLSSVGFCVSATSAAPTCPSLCKREREGRRTRFAMHLLLPPPFSLLQTRTKKHYFCLLSRCYSQQLAALLVSLYENADINR